MVSRRRDAALLAFARASRETPLTDQGDGGFGFGLLPASEAPVPVSVRFSAIVRPECDCRTTMLRRV